VTSTAPEPFWAREDPNRLGQDFLVTALGVATSFLTAEVLVAIALKFNLAIYSWTILIVVPAGAMCCGFAAASGYYFGARFFDHRPTTLLLVNSVLVSIATFFLIHYLTYYLYTVDGKALRDTLSFSDFFNWELSHTDLQYVGSSESAEPLPLSWSYVYAALQIIGFAIGGVAVYFFLKNLPYCERCSKYLATKERQSRYTADSEQLTEGTIQIQQHVAAGRLQDALVVHTAVGDAKSVARKTPLRSQITVKECKGCNRQWVKFTISRLVKSEWKDVPGAGFQQFVEPVSPPAPPLTQAG